MSKVYTVLADTRPSDGLCELCKTPYEIFAFSGNGQYDVFMYRCPQCQNRSLLLLEAVEPDEC